MISASCSLPSFPLLLSSACCQWPLRPSNFVPGEEALWPMHLRSPGCSMQQWRRTSPSKAPSTNKGKSLLPRKAGGTGEGPLHPKVSISPSVTVPIHSVFPLTLWIPACPRCSSGQDSDVFESRNQPASAFSGGSWEGWPDPCMLGEQDFPLPVQRP